MDNGVITALQAAISEEVGSAFAVYADLLSIALPVLFTFAASSLLVNLFLNAAFSGKIKWFGGK